MAEQAYQELASGNSIGDRLKTAREAKGLSLDDVATQTRIPIRHLQHIEREEWDALPAPTYCVGFVRSYANTIGLDGAELGRELRDQLGGTRTRAPAPEYFQPADPARVPPRSLAIVAGILAIVLIAGYLIWRGSLDDGEQSTSVTVPVPAATAPAADARPAAPQAQPQQLAGQPVTLAATAPVWVRVYEQGGATLMERTMAAGETYQIPATARQPMLRVGAPEALRVMVGQTAIPQLGPAGRPVGNVSIRAEDLAARLQGQASPPQPPTP